LQPFVENAIKHGIGRLNRKGKITVEIKKTGDSILVTIEDNGAGREEAEKWKRAHEGNHISHGTALTFDRIAAYNKAYNKNIRASVIDLSDSNGNSAGTRVEIRI